MKNKDHPVGQLTRKNRETAQNMLGKIQKQLQICWKKYENSSKYGGENLEEK